MHLDECRFVETGLFIIRPNGTARALSKVVLLNKASNAGYRVLDGPVRLAVASRTQAWLAAAQISVVKWKSFSDIYCHCGPSV